VKRLSGALTLNGQDRLDAIRLGLADSVPKIAGDFLPTRCPEARAFWREGSSSGPPGVGAPGGYLLAWPSALSYCGGLFCLAVLPPHGVAVPRWLIFAYGVGCALLAVLALLLSPGWTALHCVETKSPCRAFPDPGCGDSAALASEIDMADLSQNRGARQSQFLVDVHNLGP
jgi:hypothetical protein